MVKGVLHKIWFLWRVAGLSASTLLFQITLTRLFSVSQFYHFAFLIISMAMLGYAISGVILAFLPHINPQQALDLFSWISFGCALSFLIAYLVLNYLPFDSFSIIWDGRQVLLFFLNYGMLTLPFGLGGLAIGILLAALPAQTEPLYAMNFIGAGFGCLAGLVFPTWVGGEGVILVCFLIAGCCSLPLGQINKHIKPRFLRLQFLATLTLSILLLGCIIDLGFRTQGKTWLRFLDLRISPYKGLSYALQYPDARILFQRWNAFSRIDIVRSTNIRSLPGLSIQYQKPPPAQDGLFIDGDDLSPIIRDRSDLGFTGYLPTAIAFQLKPNANTLILEPHGGLDIFVAVAEGAKKVDAVESNPLIIQAAQDIYRLPQVQTHSMDQRSFLHQSSEQFDVIVLSLTTAFHPVRSGAYSLAEDYRYTTESFNALLRHLKPDGILIFNRWLQKPPSESLRAFALSVTALEQMGLSPSQRLVALRGYAMATILIKLTPFSAAELKAIHQFAAAHSLDFIYSPDLTPADINRYNVLAQPIYTETFQAVLNHNQRQIFYDSYPYDIRPPSDDHPFFNHYFKWSQIRQTLTELGKTWQPFGGAGLLTVLGLLFFVFVLGSGLVTFTFWRCSAGLPYQSIKKFSVKMALYFAAIGFGYMFIELPLIQRFQLYLIHPAYSFAIVLFTLLLFSGIGSNYSKYLRLKWVLIALCIWWLILSFCIRPLFQTSLEYPLALRAIFMGLIVAPGGFLMGCAFPAGITFWSNKEEIQYHLPLFWAINGAASVIASVTAMLLALTYGFNLVLRLGALGYGIAFLMVWSKEKLEGKHRL